MSALFQRLRSRFRTWRTDRAHAQAEFWKRAETHARIMWAAALRREAALAGVPAPVIDGDERREESE